MSIEEGVALARADREVGLRQWRVSLYSLKYGGNGFRPAVLLENRCPFHGGALVRHQRSGYCPACDLSWKVKTHRQAVTRRRPDGPWVIVYVRAGEVLP